jgi:hypothetical protein
MSADTYQPSPTKERRYKKTWTFMEPTLLKDESILDLGTKNPFYDFLA